MADLMPAVTYQIAFDLGTSYSAAYSDVKKKTVWEPTVMAFDRRKQRIVAYGSRAKSMIGFTPPYIEILQPLKAGVACDFDLVNPFLKFLTAQITGRRKLFVSRILVCLPYGTTSVEARAYRNQLQANFLTKVQLVRQPLAAAIGAGLDIFESKGKIVVNIGGGITEIALISIGGFVKCITLQAAGLAMDEAISNYLEQAYYFSVGYQQIEEIKIKYASVDETQINFPIQVKGMDRRTRLPRSLMIPKKALTEAITPVVDQILEGIDAVFETTTPEIANDIASDGIYLTGGGAYLPGWQRIIRDRFGVEVRIPREPELCIIKGLKKILENYDAYKEILEKAKSCVP